MQPGGGSLRRTESAGMAGFSPAQVGYYPELAQLVELKLSALRQEYNPLVGVLGDEADLPDGDDLQWRLQQFENHVPRKK